MYRTASTRELAEFHVFATAVAAHREDGRGSEDRGRDNRGDIGDDQRRVGHSSRKDSKDPRERRPGDRPSAGPRWDEKSERSCSSSDFSRRDSRCRSHGRKKEKHQDRSADSPSPSRSPATEQLPAPSLPRLQHLALLTVHRPAPSERVRNVFRALVRDFVPSQPERRR